MATTVTGMEAVSVSNLTFLPPIPGWEVKTYHYTHHTVHYFITDHPRGRIRQGSYLTISTTRPYPPVLDLASTLPRPTAGQQGRKADVAQDSESFHCLIHYVTMVSRDGRSFPGHVATATPTRIDKTLPQRHPRRPCLLLPYKKAGRGSTRGTNDERRTTNNRQKRPISFVISLFL
jgi:hypothetical protein